MCKYPLKWCLKYRDSDKVLNTFFSNSRHKYTFNCLYFFLFSESEYFLPGDGLCGEYQVLLKPGSENIKRKNYVLMYNVNIHYIKHFFVQYNTNFLVYIYFMLF